MRFVRPVIAAAAIYTAVLTGNAWLCAPAIGLLLLLAIREHGPTDPPPIPVTDLRRRQIDRLLENEGRRRP